MNKWVAMTLIVFCLVGFIFIANQASHHYDVLSEEVLDYTVVKMWDSVDAFCGHTNYYFRLMHGSEEVVLNVGEHTYRITREGGNLKIKRKRMRGVIHYEIAEGSAR